GGNGEIGRGALFVIVGEEPGGGQTAPGEEPQEQAAAFDSRLRDDAGKPAAEATGIGGCREVGVAEEIGIVEGAFADEPLGINGEPAAGAEIKHIVVMNVA